MRRYALGLLIFIAGWSLGWLTFHFQVSRSLRSVQPAASVAGKPAPLAGSAGATVVVAPPAPVPVDDTALLLQRNDFAAVMQRYEALQQMTDDAALKHARAQILTRVRQLIVEHQYSLAEQLLQVFLVADYRDVDARSLLAEVFQKQGDLPAAIDQLYEARGYAWQPAMLQHLTGRIRALVAELARSLKRDNDQDALLELYLHLTQLEPDHAPWFIELAAAQQALGDLENARRSLLLVAQDPDVGVHAQRKLAEVNLALAEFQDSGSRDVAADVAGIPLHRSGSHFSVDAMPASGRGIRLLIDTGATLTILTPAALEQNGIRYQETGRTGVFNTANGPVRAPVYRLDYLSVGGWQVHHLDIGVLELGGRAGVDGLLGMNFLSHFQFFIDQNKSLLRLSAN